MIPSRKLLLDRVGKKKGILVHSSMMNVIRARLLKALPNVEETFGYITKENRQNLGLSKTHYNDAIAMFGTSIKPVFETDKVLIKKCIADGDYQQTKGKRSEQRLNTRKIQGFRKFDKIRYNGKEYFIKGRMSTGYAILMNIFGEKINLKPIPKFDKMERISARKSWIMEERSIASFC